MRPVMLRKPSASMAPRSPVASQPSELMVLAVAGAADASDASYKVYVEQPGAYRVTYEDLVEAGMEPVEVASELIGLSHRGEPVPVWVDDGGDGLLGAQLVGLAPGERGPVVGEWLQDRVVQPLALLGDKLDRRIRRFDIGYSE